MFNWSEMAKLINSNFVGFNSIKCFYIYIYSAILTAIFPNVTLIVKTILMGQIILFHTNQYVKFKIWIPKIF